MDCGLAWRGRARLGRARQGASKAWIMDRRESVR
jgi:hypothetical protein